LASRVSSRIWVVRPRVTCLRDPNRWHRGVVEMSGRDRGMTTQGWAADGYEGVREAFDANFADGLEVGAAFSAYHQGAKVVDLWGGVADVREGTPWEEDSMAVVFSTTK